MFFEDKKLSRTKFEILPLEIYVTFRARSAGMKKIQIEPPEREIFAIYDFWVIWP